MNRAMTARLTFAAAFVVAGAFLFQAVKLPFSDIFGPGPGLFPTIVTGMCAAIAGLLALFPALGAEAKQGEPDETLAPDERFTFLAYAAALPLMAASLATLGFFATALLLSVGLGWWVERRGLIGVLAFGVAVGAVGVLVFHKHLETQIPIGFLDDLLLRLAR